MCVCVCVCTCMCAWQGRWLAKAEMEEAENMKSSKDTVLKGIEQ